MHSGGGLLHGCSSIPVYDPTEWIRREASNGRKFIVVTGNHRTNLLGFLASSDLAEEDPEGLAGNYGESTAGNGCLQVLSLDTLFSNLNFIFSLDFN
jgi:hypothetical protein